MTTLDDPNLNTLPDDEVGDMDWDAPESGARLPQLKPGVYDFLFKLEDDNPFETQEYNTQDGPVKAFCVNHKAIITPDASEPGHEVEVRFNRASFRRTEKMRQKHMNSRGGELLRSLGIDRISMTKDSIEAALREADGRAMGRCVIGWQFYCKADQQTISTNANTKRGEIRWPKGADGFVDVVSCPKCGATGYGRERVTDYRLPKGGV